MIKLQSLHVRGFKRLDLDGPLEFPEGPLLIYGLNESGKSTIMEAVHFALYGMPLRPTKKAPVEDILNYGADIGLVHLKFSINEEMYEVKRTVKRKGTNVHELKVTRKDGKQEVVTGFGKVNKTILDALHGIDSDALLNSCMVEQKELGKLESSQKQERINVISMLLNLEAFTHAEEYLKDSEKEKNEELNGSIGRKGIKKEVEEWRDRKEKFEEAIKEKEKAKARLAEISEELPKVEARAEELESKHNAISRLKELSKDIETHKERHSEALKKVEEARVLKDELEKLNPKILAQEEVLEADEKLEPIQSLVGHIEDGEKLIARDEPEVTKLRAQLENLGDIDKKIEEKERLVRGLEGKRETALKNRMLGYSLGIGGGIVGLVLGFLVSTLLLLVAVASVALWVYLVRTTKMEGLDVGIENEGNLLKKMEAEKLNLDNYQAALTEKTTAITGAKSKIEEYTRALSAAIEELPNSPSPYRDNFRGNYPRYQLDAMKALTQSIQRDREERVRMQERKENIKLIVVDLDNREKKAKDLNEKLRETKDEKDRLKKESGVRIEDEERLKKEHSGARTLVGKLGQEQKDKTEVLRECNETIEENKEAPKSYEERSAIQEALEFDLESTTRAKKLLTSTRDGVVGSVKEKIEANMMKFLPLLTAGRYKAAKIDEKEYKIEVYDKEARRWRIKGVFSGATQDQISLALRLAFALSTLPSSKGVVPGFIFLDEPLSGFDEERKKGLIELLTKGDIARQFNQIIVISHGEQLKDEFPFKVHLEKGKVVHSLPM